ncbi:unnamed protein product, partial [Candidula unifasciata]
MMTQQHSHSSQQSSPPLKSIGLRQPAVLGATLIISEILAWASPLFQFLSRPYFHVSFTK